MYFLCATKRNKFNYSSRTLHCLFKSVAWWIKAKQNQNVLKTKSKMYVCQHFLITLCFVLGYICFNLRVDKIMYKMFRRQKLLFFIKINKIVFYNWDIIHPENASKLYCLKRYYYLFLSIFYMDLRYVFSDCELKGIWHGIWYIH